jgi:polygalacturonase
MSRYLSQLGLLLAGALTVGSHALLAQDTRTVTQPVIPSNCAALTAEITATADDLNSTANAHFDTSRIQSALNSCTTGHAVELSLGTTYNGVSGHYNAYQIQPITIPAGVTLLIDQGVTVFASLNPQDYAVTSGSCGLVTSGSASCKSLITISSANGAAIMGPGVINGRGGDVIENTSPTMTWWSLLDESETLGDSYARPILISISNSNSVVLYQIQIENAPQQHVVYNYGNGFTVWGITINTPYSSQNSDGLDIGNSQNVTVTQSTLSDGDDDVAIGSASGSEAEDYTISNNHIFAGHGVSIGSITSSGVANILVENNTFSGNTADANSTALRIKSAADRGGLVNNVQYENICIQNSNSPLQLNPHYNTNSGTEIPHFTNIGFHDVNVLTAGDVEIQGYSSSDISTVTLDNVNFVSLPSGDITPAPEYATITLGPGPVSSNLTSGLTGTGVTVINDVSNGNAPYSCPASAFGTPPIPDGTYVVLNNYDGRALTDPSGSTSQGTIMEQVTNTNATYQQWIVTNLGNNIVNLTNVASGYNLDVFDNSKSSGGLIDQWSANYATNQEWQLTSVGNNLYELSAVSSGMALSVVGGSSGNDVQLDQTSYSGGLSQQWKFVAP